MSHTAPGFTKRVSNAVRTLISRAYFAGPELDDAVRVYRKLAQKDFSGTIGYWPDNNAPPREVADAYLSNIRTIAEQRLNCTVSIKAMVMDFNRDLMHELGDAASTAGVGIHYDSRSIEFADPAFDSVIDLAQRNARVGCTLPGLWPRSLDDADRVSKLDIYVRVVKGQWRDPEHADIDLRQGYLAVIDRLCGRKAPVGVATHDARLAREALQRLQHAGTPCDLEQLFGLPTRETLRVARELGVKTRYYIPYGNSWVPYVFSRIARRPRILLWIARDLLFGRWSYRVK